MANYNTREPWIEGEHRIFLEKFSGEKSRQRKQGKELRLCVVFLSQRKAIAVQKKQRVQSCDLSAEGLSYRQVQSMLC